MYGGEETTAPLVTRGHKGAIGVLHGSGSGSGSGKIPKER